MRKVAVTGGLSCGKSLVCKLLEEKGAFYVSADDLVHQLLLSDPSLKRDVFCLLGEEVAVKGCLDRVKIAQKVFSNRELLTSLERLLHPRVFERICQLYEGVKSREDYSLFVVEIPLLYEAGFESSFDTVIVVAAEQDRAKKWFEKERGLDGKEFEKRSLCQGPLEEKKRRADYLIINEGTIDSLKSQVAKLYTTLTK